MSWCAQFQKTIEDHTLVQRWEKGKPKPWGPPPDGWYDYIGSAKFNTFRIKVVWAGDDVSLQIFTNYPETGISQNYPEGLIEWLPRRFTI